MKIPTTAFLTFKSGSLSLMLHLIIGLLLIFSFNATPEPPRPRSDPNIVKAVAVDKKQVENELNRIKILEQEKHRKEQQRLQQLAKQTKKLVEDRKAEEKRLEAARKKKQQEQQQLEAARKKKQQEQQQLEATRKKKQQEQQHTTELREKAKELEKKRASEEKKIKETEQRAVQLKAEEEDLKKQKFLEQALAVAVAAEEDSTQQRTQQLEDEKLVNRIKRDIEQSIVNNFNLAGLPDNLECKLLIRLVPGGQVINVSITKSSHNDVFDSRAINATQKASPLPVPADLTTFERLDLREINVIFRPISNQYEH